MTDSDRDPIAQLEGALEASQLEERAEQDRTISRQLAADDRLVEILTRGTADAG